MEKSNPDGIIGPDYWKLEAKRLQQDFERLTVQNEEYRRILIQALRFQADHPTGLEALLSGSGSSSDVEGPQAKQTSHPIDLALQEGQQNKPVIEITHPLLRKDIVLHIARYLDHPLIAREENGPSNTRDKDRQDNFKTLQNARLVCRKWNEVFALKIQKHCSLRANFTERTVADFVTDISVTLPDGTTKITFESINIDDPRHLDSEIFQTWIAEYGRNLRRIILGEIHSDSNMTKYMDELQYCPSNLRKLLLNWCPNLKSLIILAPIINHYNGYHSDKENLSENDDSDAGNLDMKPTGVKVVQLDQLKIGSKNHCTEVQRQLDIETTIQCVFRYVLSVKSLRIESYGAPHQLQTFDRMPKEVRSVWENLEELDLQKHLMVPYYLAALTRVTFVGLKTLKIGHMTEFGNAAQHLIKMLLQNIAVNAALKELELNDRKTRLAKKSVEINPLLQIQTLRKLKICPLDQWAVSSMDFMLTLPGLRSLEIVGPQLPADVIVSPGKLFGPEIRLRTEPHLNLRELRMNCWIIDKSIFEGIAQSFPNLELLRLIFIGADVGECIGHLAFLKKLVELDLFITENIQGKEEMKLQMDIIANLPSYRSLRKLKIRVIPVPLRGVKEYIIPAMSLTFDTFVYGFMKLPVLEVLTLDGFKVAVEFPDEFVKMVSDSKVPRMIMNHVAVENKVKIPVGYFVMGKYSKIGSVSLDGARS